MLQVRVARVALVTAVVVPGEQQIHATIWHSLGVSEARDTSGAANHHSDEEWGSLALSTGGLAAASAKFSARQAAQVVKKTAYTQTWH